MYKCFLSTTQKEEWSSPLVRAFMFRSRTSAPTSGGKTFRENVFNGPYSSVYTVDPLFNPAPKQCMTNHSLAFLTTLFTRLCYTELRSRYQEEPLDKNLSKMNQLWNYETQQIRKKAWLTNLMCIYVFMLVCVFRCTHQLLSNNASTLAADYSDIMLQHQARWKPKLDCSWANSATAKCDV